MNFFSNKRAITGNMWWTLGMTVLAAIVILATFSFFAKLAKLPSDNLGSQEEQGTLANLEIIGNKVQEFLDNSDDSIGEQNFPYFIGNEFILVGFDKKWDNNKVVKARDLVRAQGQEKISKPLECFSKTCLCIYENKGRKLNNLLANDFGTDSIPLDCTIFEENIIFLGISGEDTNYGESKAAKDFGGKIIQTNYEYLVVYGSELKTAKPFYVEKHDTNDQIYIFISHQDLTVVNP